MENKRLVLVVDKVPSSLLVKRILEVGLRSTSVEEANDEGAAVALLNQKRFDLVVFSDSILVGELSAVDFIFAIRAADITKSVKILDISKKHHHVEETEHFNFKQRQIPIQALSAKVKEMLEASPNV